MLDYILNLFAAAQFVPHAVCLLWRPDLLIMHGVSDFLISAAYLTIPLIILRAVNARPDLIDPGVARLFAAFITACALSHLGALLTLWYPAYALQGVIKVLTAFISILTAIQLIRLLPTFLTMPSREEIAQKDALYAVAQEKALAVSEERDKLSEFAFIASHDLKAPMRGISNQADFLLEDHGDALEPDARNRLMRMRELCSHLEDLVATLLKYSRIGRSQSSEDVDTTATIDSIRSSLREFLNDKSAKITVETPLPTIKANPADVTTIFQNLIVNGLTYNDADQKKIAVGFVDEVSIEGLKMTNAFYVRDNGIGIDEEFHDDVFRLFKRLHRPEAYGDGSGAGLTFVKKVIETNGGTIRLTSTSGQGTTFYFSFTPQPIAEPATARTTGRFGHA